MAKMLLINPRKRRASRKTRKAPSAKQRANWARFAAAARARRSANPAKRRARRRNPVAGRSVTRAYRRITRRRRNPINLGGSAFNFRSYLSPIKDAVIMGAGGVAMDVGYSYVNRMLPASMQRTPGVLGVGDAIKVVLTVLAGRLLARPTRGLSNKAALGALTVQAYNAAATFLPATMPVNGMGYVTAGRVVQGSGRTNANVRAGQMGRVGMYVGGSTPLLSGSTVGQYVGGGSPLLSRSPVRR